MAANKEVVKLIDTCNEFQTALEVGQVQQGVVICDIFNAEWGHCKALNEAFRRLFTDAGDEISIRFYAVECNKVLHTLHHPDPHQPPRVKPKQMEFHPDTTPACWESILSSRQDHSKPYFLYFKEGKLRGHQEGVDTPKIYKCIHDLCATQTPASKTLSNETVMTFWLRYFSEKESVITSTEFLFALEKMLGVDTPEYLHDDERANILELAGVSNGRISAGGLQNWIGEDGDFTQVLCTLFPNSPLAMQALGSVTSVGSEHHEVSSGANREQHQNRTGMESSTQSLPPAPSIEKAEEEHPNGEELEELHEGDDGVAESMEGRDDTADNAPEEGEDKEQVRERESEGGVEGEVEGEEDNEAHGSRSSPPVSAAEQNWEEGEDVEGENREREEGSGNEPTQDAPPPNQLARSKPRVSHNSEANVVKSMQQRTFVSAMSSKSISNHSVENKTPFAHSAPELREDSNPKLMSSGEEGNSNNFPNSGSAVDESEMASFSPQEKAAQDNSLHISHSEKGSPDLNSRGDSLPGS